jgi:very-short-patch-repair endonuclease
VSVFDAAEVVCRDGLPITTPERTLLDLAVVIASGHLEQALARGVRERIVTVSRMESVLARHPRRRGTRLLRALLAAAAGPAFTRSEAEARFLELMRQAGIREAETNVVVHGVEVDVFWRLERLVVEIDGYAFHHSRDAFERDRARDAILAAAGIRVLRVTWRQIEREPMAVVARVAQALARSFVS